MRNIYCLVLSMVFLPFCLSAQKKSVKKNPGVPVVISTSKGTQTLYSRPGKVVAGKIKPQLSPRKNSVRKKTQPNHTPYQRIGKTVRLNPGKQTSFRPSPTVNTRELFIYDPKKEFKSSSKQLKAPQGYYASVTLSSQADLDNFSTNFPACTSVGSLIIDGSITNIDNLAGITDVGYFAVKNTSLTSLNAMTALTSVSDSLVIENNNSLTSIGLSNLSTLGGLVLRDLPALTTLDAFNSSLTDISNDVIVQNAALTSLDGLSAVVNIGGDLKITNSAVVSPDMSALRTVGYMWFDNNNQMTDPGLSFITKMDGLFLYNLPQLTSLGISEFGLTTRDIATLWLGNLPQLTDISFVQQFTSVANIILMDCDLLTNMDAFQNINSAYYGIFIYANDALQNISGLSGIETVEADKLEVSSNPNLTSLDGLQNILETDALWITDNASLTSLSDLNTSLEIHNVNGDDLHIMYNSNLSLCDVPAICNYLNSGKAVNPQIAGNAGSCVDLSTVSQSCGNTGNCTVKDAITWNGDVSSDWTDPQNWTPNKVPDACSIVTIPSGMPNDPSIGADVSIGGLIMESAWLYLSDCILTIKDTFHIYDSYIYDDYDYGYSTVRILNAVAPKASYSSFIFTNGNLEIRNFTGETDFYGNVIYGNVTMIDNPSRTDRVYTFGNEINGSLTYVNNSPYGNNYLANGNAYEDYIYGDLNIKNTSYGSISVGLGSDEPLVVEGNVKIEATDQLSVFVDKITFSGSNFQTLTVPEPIIGVGLQRGPIEPSGYFEIQNFFMRKYYESFLVLNQPVFVRSKLVMGYDQSAILSQANKMLILGNNLMVTDEDPEEGSFIEGPVKKIGDDAFTFPLGKIEGLPMLTGNTPPPQSNSLQQKSHSGYFKAPLSISAPSGAEDAFIAEYKHTDPNYDGYDTSLKAPGTGDILANEYWVLQRDAGTSDVSVSLTYDQFHIGLPFAPGGLRVVGWNGGQWTDFGNGGTTGNNNRGMVTSLTPLTNYGPLALSSQNIRKPVATVANLSDSFFCKNTSFKVHFTLDTSAVDGSVFKVELSDENGIFGSSNTVIGSKSTKGSDSIPVSLPASTTTGGHYQVRVVGSPQSIVSTNSVTVIPIVAPQVKVTIEGEDSLCMNTDIKKYFISGKETGVSYNWVITGGNFTVSGDSAFVTFTSAGDQTVRVNSSNKCGSGTAVIKTVKIKAGTPTQAASLSTVGRWIYASVPDAAQKVTVYKWFKNGSLISGAGSLSYYASEAGIYSIKYANSCGDGPQSNTIEFENASQPQTITFNVLPDKIYGDEPFALEATSTSGLPVAYQIISGPGNITEGIFTITKTGTVVIKAFQPGDNVYDTAAPVTRSFKITKTTQSIVWDSMPDYDFFGSTIYVQLPKYSSGGLPINYQSTSPNVTLNANQLRITGIGSVTITGSQAGDTNYVASLPVTQTFCVKVAALNSITGAEYVCPGQETVYRINKVAGLSYQWRLSDGTILSSNADTAKITWGATGSYQIFVSATGPCGPATPEDSLSVTVMDGVTAPEIVQNMLPQNGVIDQKLPLLLSWVPGNHTLSYDVFIWENGSSKPPTPFTSNLTKISYEISKTAGLVYDKIYNWQVISKNGCQQTAGPVQTFRLRKATDLAVTQVMAPLTANSGQKITINWTVKNIGPGNTLTNESWSDAVFLSFDTIPAFLNPAFGGIGWNALDFPVKPLLLGTKKNVSALNVGEEYTNSMDFDIPLSYSQPLYVYVITNYKGGANQPPQSNFVNDTARQDQPINVVLTPTPDLRVDTIFTPATTFSGSVINVTYKVKNYGALTPSGSNWNDKLYISKSPLFVKKNALPLKFAKQNETFYPAVDVVVGNSTLLQTDSSLTRSVQVVVPNFISGTWFIHVVTNEDQKMYEGALAENNENNRALQVLLTPTPQLTISSINTPLTNVSTTQTVGVNWNIFNAGFYDNIEKNKGFYGETRGVCKVGGRSSNGGGTTTLNSNARGGGSGTVEVLIVPKEFDSLSWGSSYWVDKIYLSTDPSGLQTGIALYLGEATKGIKDLGWRMPDDIIQSNTHCVTAYGHDPVPGGTTANVLRPGSNHSNQFSFKIPKDLPDGDYYIYIQTNATNTVFTYIDTPVIKRSAKITVSRADLTIGALTVPAAITGGTPFTIDYTVTNTGAGSVYNFNRTDRIYMSNSPVYDGNAQLIKTVQFSEDVITGTPVSHSIVHTLPNNLSGTRYFFVRTNADSTLAENNFNNNVSAVAMSNVSTALPVDLIVTTIAVPDTIAVPGQFTLNYTIKNNGSNTASGETTDSIYISCNPVYDPATVMGVGARKNNRNLAAGGTVNDTAVLNLNSQAYLLNACFAKGDYSTVYYHVKVNTGLSIYEGTNSTNNVVSSGKKTFANRNVDYEISNLTSPDTAIVGRPYLLTWKLKNVGLYQNKNIRKDQVIFSTDSTNFDDGITSTSSWLRNLLSPGDSIQHFFWEPVPKMPTGDYYIKVITDVNGDINTEVHKDNNTLMLRDENGQAMKVHVVLPLLADLVSEIQSAPERLPIGQPVDIKYKVTNQGDGITYPDKWYDQVWLAKSNKPDTHAGDRLLYTKYHTGNVDVNENYEDSVSVNIPLDITPGNYLLVTIPDSRNSIIEKNDTNNYALRPVLVYAPEPVDLVVTNVTAPDTVYLGYLVDSVRWHIQNLSANPSEGVSTDGIYLSKSPVYDSSARLIGLKNKMLDMPAVGTDNLSAAPVTSGVPEGNYYIIVRTDILNNIPETDKTNNEAATALPVFVSVKELKLDETLSDTMSVPKYYKLVIPDSLLGSTVLLTLKTEDSLTRRNELYVGGGYIPSVLQWDYRFNTPDYGNQQVLINDITQSVYYISARSVSQPLKKQNITLQAVKLPFAILISQTNRGGNGGSVTVKLTGSLFTDSMTARLTNGSTTINATKVYFINSTVVYATFPLQGKPLGVYDIVLTKKDHSEAILDNGFSIVSPDNGGLYATGMNTGPSGPGTQPGCDPGAPAGLNSQLVTEMVVPEKVFAGWPFVIQINYSNPTNMDIPVQTRVLYNDYNVPMSFNKENLTMGTDALLIEISESDGPPGVIRAGSSGTITIYSKTAADAKAHDHIKFNLK